MSQRTLVTFLLDRSGSMGSIINETITAFNEYLQGLLTGEGSGLVDFTLVTFDTQSMDKVCVAVPVVQAPKLSRENYVPRAGTPLIDAAVTTLKAVEASLEKGGNPKVVMVIQTDGQENSSVKHVDARQSSEIGLIMKGGVDRHEIVAAAELHCVPAVIDERDVGVAGNTGEPDGRFLHTGLVEIEADDRLEAKPLQHLRHVGRIIPWILQRGGVLVGRITNDECDTLLGVRWKRDHNKQKRK
jgi:hypothetical protein